MPDINSINLKIYKPCELLADHIHSIWFAHNLNNTECLSFRVLNDGSMGLVLNFSDEICIQKNNTKTNIQQGVINGASSNLTTFTFTAKVSCVGIRFLPTSNLYFIASTVESLSGSIQLLNDEYFEGYHQLYQSIQSLIMDYPKSQSKIVDLIELHLVNIFNKNKLQNPYGNNECLFRKIIYEIQSNHDASIEALCQKYKLSLRQLQRMFKKYVGVSPKVFKTLNRVRKVKERISENDFGTLTELSVDSGYFDQAHFIKDFKTLMNETPNAYHKLKMNNKNE